MATETWTDAETLRRAANAVRNLIDGHGNRRWCDWVPRHLDLIADRMDNHSEPALSAHPRTMRPVPLGPDDDANG